MAKKLISIFFALAIAPFSNAHATDALWKVVNVAENDHLNVRAGPTTFFETVMSLPPNAKGLKKEVCVLVKHTPDATHDENQPEWCAISNSGSVLGWVNAYYLALSPEIPTTNSSDILRIGSGYGGEDDPCRFIGESDATIDFLDHTRDLVGCPKGSPNIEERLFYFVQEGGEILEEIDGFVLVSIPNSEN